jgi:hypothetical protein
MREQQETVAEQPAEPTTINKHREAESKAKQSAGHARPMDHRPSRRHPATLHPIPPHDQFSASYPRANPEGWSCVNMLDPAAWMRYTADLRAVLPDQAAAYRHALYSGPFGEGAPILDTARVAFNGNALGRTWVANQLRDDPAYGRAIEDCDDSHEPFIIRRAHDANRPVDAWLPSEIATTGKPYAIGVRPGCSRAIISPRRGLR